VLGGGRLTFPEAFDNAAWTKVGVTVDPDVATAPDLTTTADKITGSGGVPGEISQNDSVAAGTFVMSVFFWQGNEYSMELRATQGSAYFNISYYAPTKTWSINGVNGATAVRGGVIYYPNPFTGYQRVWVEGTLPNTGAVTWSIRGWPTDGKYAYLWGAQVSEGTGLPQYY
jgi:hypothetical protein